MKTKTAKIKVIIEDVLGALCLFGMLYTGLLIVGVYQ